MTAEQRHKAMWAIAMVQEAGELAASIPNLPPIERRAASIRTAALSSTASELLADGGSGTAAFNFAMRPAVPRDRPDSP